MDHDAYRDESPLPSQERLYLYYLRNRKKADLRRAVQSNDSEDRYFMQNFSELQVQSHKPIKPFGGEVELANIGPKR